MVESSRRNLKRFYILSNLGILLLLALTISFLFWRNYRQVTEAHSNELREEILRSKREFIENAVNRTIQVIEFEQKRCAALKNEVCDQDELKGRLREYIRSIRLKDDGYIWVNAVLNYDGGDNYALRFVHPNLPETEGMMLSTKVQDIKGNTPYLTELEGVKKDGEIFFDYWFKKMNSDVIQHKMTFAKLYKPYDWIVASGVYLDDIEELVQSRMVYWQKWIQRAVLIPLAIIGIASILAWLLSLLVGRRVDKIYSYFLKEIGDREEALQCHKEFLEEEVRDRTTSLAAMNRELEEEIATREEMELSVRLMNFAMDKVREATFLITEKGRFHYVNEESCRRLGYSREELLALSVADVDPDWPAERWPEHWRELKDKGSLTFEGRHQARDGRFFPVEINANYFQYEGQGFNLALARDITERKQNEQKRLADLRFFESMDRVNLLIQGATDIETMMNDVLDAVLDIFDCDRAYLLFPCDPDAPTWQVPMEKTRPEYPGVLELKQEIPMVREVAATFRILLTANGPVKFGPGSVHPVPVDVAKHFHVKTFMAMTLRPQIGQEWQFGIHQCSRTRQWSPDEEKLFNAIGRRMSDSLSTMLSYQDLRASEERYRLLVNTANEGIWVLDPDARTTFVNARISEMLGYAAEEIQGRLMSEFIPDEEQPDHQSRMTARHHGLSEHYERRFLHRNGTTVWSHISAVPIMTESGEFEGSFGMISDITEKKKAEDAVRQLNEELEQRVTVRTNELASKGQQLLDSRQALTNLVEDLNEQAIELEEANRKLQGLDQLKSMFIASMSHELRTPLNSIIGFSTIVLDEWFGPLNDDQKKNLATVLRAGKHLLALINDVIDVSKIEAGTIDSYSEDFALEALINDAVEMVKTNLTEKGLRLEVEPTSCHLHTDRQRLFQCLLNLLSNAVKFTEHGTIRVTTSLLKGGKNKDHDWLQIRVSDTGIGIAPEDHSRLFTPFSRIDSPLQPAVPGTGLGLYLVRKICQDILKGEVGMESAWGKGSSFFLNIPLITKKTEENNANRTRD